MSAPPRIQAIVQEIARAHEVPEHDIWGEASYRQAQDARMACYRAAYSAPKPNGKQPTVSEVARWFGKSWTAINHALSKKDAA
jgi:hypothetical protein